MRFLVVDDEPLNRFLLTHMLEQEGYLDVVSAENGEQAITLAEQTNPDIVLLDILMPGISGFEVAPKLKEMAGDLYLPIIFITALDDEESVTKGLAVGGDDFMSKPFDRVILAAKIRAHARTRELSIKAHEQNAQLTYHQHLVEREHAIVEHIFENALQQNESLLELVDYHVAPASNFNGDMLLIEQGPAGNLYILLGDFTGHGLASAIGALPVTRAFQAMSKKGLAVPEMAETLNSTLLALLPGDMFFAAAIVEISSTGCQFNIWAGGMPHLIVLDNTKAEAEIIRIESQHMALGILDEDEFENTVNRYKVNPGSRLLCYSDGVIESNNQNNEMLGEEGLEGWLLEQPDMPFDSLIAKINDYRGENEQEDDITLACFTCQPLDMLADEVDYPITSWTIEMHLEPAQIKVSEPVSEIMELVAAYKGLSGLRSNLFTVLSELYNNALDHGLLGLDSKLKDQPEGFSTYFEERETRFKALNEGFIHIKLDYDARESAMTITLKDSGQGFEVEKNKSEAESEVFFGRGLALIEELASEFTYRDGGSTAEVVFRLP